MDTSAVPLKPESPAERRAPRPRTVVISIVAALLTLAVAAVAIIKATDSPTFCGSACHEMTAYHTAWSTGPHKGIACVECHVDPGPVAEISHKIVALQEVVDHLKGAPSFPLAEKVNVPDSRCIRCHQSIVSRTPGFSHAYHASRGPCMSCHADAGHDTTRLAQSQGRIVRVAYVPPSHPTSQAVVGQGQADLPGHVSVGCSNCHDMAATACSACHTPGPNHAGRPSDCSICHAPGPRFVFTHPQRTDCATCHTPPADLKPPHPTRTDCTLCHVSGPGVDWKFTHPQLDTCGDCHTPPTNLTPAHPSMTQCTLCHTAGPGKSFAFTHPGRGADCTTCHNAPANHHSGTCSTCHRDPGSSWAFTHPSSSACTSCHSAPGSGHTSSTECATCHRNPGVNWAFAHPERGATCASCHNRPSSHSAGACQNCHQNPGRSWAFTHPSATNCTSCHTPPSNHYGTTCQKCHVAGTKWSSASFDHPKIPNNSPHTYKTWPCAKCHPNGTSSYFCTCHNNTTGPNDN